MFNINKKLKIILLLLAVIITVATGFYIIKKNPKSAMEKEIKSAIGDSLQTGLSKKSPKSDSLLELKTNSNDENIKDNIIYNTINSVKLNVLEVKPSIKNENNKTAKVEIETYNLSKILSEADDKFKKSLNDAKNSSLSNEQLSELYAEFVKEGYRNKPKEKSQVDIELEYISGNWAPINSYDWSNAITGGALDYYRNLIADFSNLSK